MRRGVLIEIRPRGPAGPGVLVQSPKSDIYVVLLGISLGAIVISAS